MVYGSNTESVRKQLWRDLNSWVDDTNSWVIFEDFNVVKFGYERSPEVDTSQAMIDFNDCIINIGGIEPNNVGNAFTWSSMRGNEDMRKNHCPIMLSWDKEERIKRSFKFFNFWMESDKFKIILKEVWSKQVSGSKMFQVSEKLKILKSCLQMFDKRKFSNISTRVSEARLILEDLQKRMLGDEVSQSLFQEEKEVITKFRALSSLEENYIKQKSRQNWLSLRESNTSFLYRKCSTRNLRNWVHRIKTSDGVIVQGKQLVHDEAIRFYRDLIGTRRESTSHIHFLHQILTKKVTMEESRRMIEVISKEEIKHALFSMSWDKSPGPDGFNAKFFKENWGVIGHEVSEGVLEFFQNRRMLKQWNVMGLLKIYGRKYISPQCISTPNFIVSVNEVHDGYFKGENGVRQGDPLSSYLFVLIMGIFENVFKMLRKNLPYIHHPQCREEDITHIFFADDLFIMAHAFSSVTSLVINEGKILAFYGGVKEEIKASNFYIVGILEGSLPVCYLGIPLSAKQLQISHCRSLIEKVKNSMNGWATKRLSYAGWIKLVTKVIMGIIGYWA
ncbi:uncharacterized protein LOC124943821 [Impatiens glandulifera]|uniref:uncharacterized protein LOC124943821 n=1 Tax=Impatiens glandulifera TaxID=253017 RepID=UPI001FB1105E|nr:uncharacterized protein LOC124943821 [Impatiens glandulifera]